MAEADILSSAGGLNSSSITGAGATAAITSKPLVTVLVLLAVAALVGHILSPNVDGREPPVLKPRIPIIGHLISMIRDQGHFLSRLPRPKRMPIATLPMLNGKVYAVWDAALIQSIYRNKNLSFVPFAVDFAQRELKYTDEEDKIVRESGLMDEFFDSVHEGMSSYHTHRMNANALRSITEYLGGIDNEKEIPNLFIWLRDLMTVATCEALYGPENPLRGRQDLINDVWTFESNLTLLLLDVFPSITAPKGHGARNRLQSALQEYYGRKADKDASGIVQCRTNVVRKYGIRDDRVGTIELALLHVSTSNTIPTLFWLVAHIITRPDVVERLREEVIAVVKHTAEGEVTVDVSDLTDNCPLLVSSYRETIRLNNVAIGNRRVMTDTIVSDGKGNTYLLKEGINLQMPSEPLHLLEDVWGPDAADFSADRFLDQAKGLNNESVKAKRASYNPFGGGRHLCPGRHFAFAENLGFMVQFLLSFDVEPLDGNWDSFKAPGRAVPYLVEAVCKPEKHGEGFGARIKKREGWQNTKWKWTSSGH